MFKRLLAAVLAFVAMSVFAAVDVNKATPAELDGVKGIGPAISAKIVAERSKSPFKDWDDMVNRVSGIGEKSALKLSEGGLTVNGAAYKGAVAKPAAPAATKPAAAAAATTAAAAATPAAAAKPSVAASAAKAAAPAAATAAVAKPMTAAANDPKAEKAAAKKAEKEAKKAAADKAKADKAEKAAAKKAEKDDKKSPNPKGADAAASAAKK
jgi:competence protein ComEA